MAKRIYTHFGKAAKYDGDVCIEPKMGYNWWYWIPGLSWNKGNPFKQQVLDLTICWLNRYFSLTLYPKWINDSKNLGQQLSTTPLSDNHKEA